MKDSKDSKEITLKDLGLTEKEIEIIVDGARVAFGQVLPPPIKSPSLEEPFTTPQTQR